MLATLRLASIVLALLSFASCSARAPQRVWPGWKAPEGTEEIAIVGTNDIHGAIAPTELRTRERPGVPSVSYRQGGVAYLASYIRELRDEWGNHLLWLDAGDQFQGTIESNSNHGAAMVRFFNATGLDAAAIGNHEFDYGAEPAGSPDRLGALKNRMREAKYPYLAANIYDRATGELEPFPNTFPGKILRVGDLKVGVIGLTTISTPTTTRPENVVSLAFGDLREATLRETRALRASGADIIVIVAHAGLFCDLSRGGWSSRVRGPGDPQGSCERDQEITRLLGSLPAGTVDAVISGHTHSVVHHWIAGVPVVQAASSGRYLNVIYLAYDPRAHRLLTDQTRIEGPIPVCPEVFENQGDCDGYRHAPPSGRGPLVRPLFHGHTIVADARAQAAIQPALDAAAKISGEVYGQAVRPIETQRYRESPLGDLVADGVRAATGSDFAIVNSGGIRAPLEQGPITYGNIFRVLPFDNSIIVLHVTGRQLKNILRVGESGSRGFHPVSGLWLKILDPAYKAPARDLNGDGRIEPWEINRLLEARTSAGAPINDHKRYTLATIDFLVSGGDDYGWPMSRIPLASRQNTKLLMRDAVASYIRKRSAQEGGLNSVAHPIVDPASPRLVFAKPGPSRERRHRAAQAQ